MNPLLSGGILATLLRLAIPNTLGTIVIITPIVLEAWRLGQLGSAELAGVAMVFPLFMLSTMLSAGAIGGAFGGATARALGANKLLDAQVIARSAVVVALAGGLLSWLLVVLFGEAFFALLGGNSDGDGESLTLAWQYASTLFPGIFIVWLFNLLSSLLRGAGDMVPPLIAALLMTGVYAVSSGPVVTGVAGHAGFGMRGAALLILGAYAVGAAFLVWKLRRPEARVRLCRGPFDWSLVAPVVGRGLLAGVQSVLTIITSFVVTGLAGRISLDALAGYGLGARIELLMIPVIFGVGGAAIAMSGAAVGAGDRRRAVRVGWASGALAFLIVGAIGAVLALTTALWVPWFTDDASIAVVLTDYMQRVGPMYGFFALGLSLYFASQGLNTLMFPVLGTVVRLGVVLVVSALWFKGEPAEPMQLFLIVAVAMASYGVVVAGGLFLGPWRRAA